MKSFCSRCIPVFMTLLSTNFYLTNALSSNFSEEYALSFSDNLSASLVRFSDLTGFKRKFSPKPAMECWSEEKFRDPVRYTATKKNGGEKYHIDIYPDLEKREYAKSSENGKWICLINFPPLKAKLLDANENFVKDLSLNEIETIKNLYTEDFTASFYYSQKEIDNSIFSFYRKNKEDLFSNNASIIKYFLDIPHPFDNAPKSSDLKPFLDVILSAEETAEPFNKYRGFESFYDTYYPETDLGDDFICTLGSCSIDNTGLAFHVGNDENFRLSLPIQFSLKRYNCQGNLPGGKVTFFFKTPYTFKVCESAKNIEPGLYYIKTKEESFYVQKEKSHSINTGFLITEMNLDQIFNKIPDEKIPLNQCNISLADLLKGNKRDTLSWLVIYRTICLNGDFVLKIKGETCKDYQTDNLVRFLFRYEGDESAIGNLDLFLGKNGRKLHLFYGEEHCPWSARDDQTFIKILPRLKNLKELVLNDGFGAFDKRFTENEFKELAKNLDILDLGDKQILDRDVSFLKDKISSLEEIRFKWISLNALSLSCHAEAVDIKTPLRISGNLKKFKELGCKNNAESVEAIKHLLWKHREKTDSELWRFAIHYICKQKTDFKNLTKIISRLRSKKKYDREDYRSSLDGAVLGGFLTGTLGVVGFLAGGPLVTIPVMTFLGGASVGLNFLDNPQRYALNNSSEVASAIGKCLEDQGNYWFLPKK